MDRIIGVVEVRTRLRELLEKVARGERFIIAQRSRAKAVLLSPETVETLEVMADKRLLEDLVVAKLEIQHGRVRPWKAYLSTAKRTS